MLKNAERIVCISLFALILLLPLGTVLTAIFSYRFVLISGMVFAAATVALEIAAIAVSEAAGSSSHSVGVAVLYALMAPLSLINTVFYAIKFSSIGVITCMLISVLLCFCLSLRYGSPKELKIISAVLAALAVVPVLFLCGMCLLMGDFGSTTVVETLESPDGKYYAQVVDYDQGALGADTVVEVYRTGDIDLGIFKIIRGPRQVYFGEWREYENMLIYWRDDNSLVVQGRTRFKE